MALKYAKGKYHPVNQEKYAGRNVPTYRSSWELSFMRFCDNHPSVIQWASEAISIPYKNPLTGNNTFYIPDFFIMYQDKNGRHHAELIEVKPRKQTTLKDARSPRDKAAAMVNYAKWAAADAWAKQNGMVFRVVTEDNIYQGSKKR